MVKINTDWFASQMVDLLYKSGVSDVEPGTDIWWCYNQAGASRGDLYTALQKNNLEAVIDSCVTEAIYLLFIAIDAKVKLESKQRLDDTTN